MPEPFYQYEVCLSKHDSQQLWMQTARIYDQYKPFFTKKIIITSFVLLWTNRGLIVVLPSWNWFTKL